MTGLNPNIGDDSLPYIIPPSDYSVSESTKAGQTTTGGVSSIESSKDVVIPFTPPANAPLLIIPMNGSEDAFSVVLTTISNNKGSGVEGFLMSQQLQMNSLIDDMLDSWHKNIQEIEAQIQQILNSPNYQALREIQLHGDQSQGAVSGISSTSSAQNVIASFTDRLQTIEKVSSSSSTSETSSTTSSTDEGSKAVSLTFMASVLIGGAIAIGAFEMTSAVGGMSSTPFTGSVEIVNRLQPLFPALMQDILPMVNLMVMPLIYYSSWDTSIGNMRNKANKNDSEVAQNFAKEVIKLVSNPAFIYVNIIEKASSSVNLSEAQKAFKTAILKLVLACVALSLLYSIDVGKAMSGKFWGMEPQEFKGLLSGEITLPTGKNLTPSQQLQVTLIKQVQSQLDALPPEERAKVLEAIFEYFTTSHSIGDMVDPAKVFHQVLSNGAFNSSIEINALENQPS